MRKAVWAFLIALLFFQGCAVSQNTSRTDEPCETKLYQTTWRLTTIDNDPVRLKFPVTLKIGDDGRIGGFGGCNEYFGKAEITDNAIAFGPIGSTRKFCMGEAGRVERRLFSMLRGTKWWQLDGGELVIFDDEHRLIFTPERP